MHYPVIIDMEDGIVNRENIARYRKVIRQSSYRKVIKGRINTDPCSDKSIFEISRP